MICTLLPRQPAEVQLARGGGVSCRTQCDPPPGGCRSEQEGKRWARLGQTERRQRDELTEAWRLFKLVWFDSASVRTSVAPSAGVKLGKVDGGTKLFGIVLLNVLKPRERRLLCVRHVQVVHG